jgi:hypothetical protein
MTNKLIESISSGEILYYPTIEFQSDAWLKAALCVWEKVYRIVPSTYTPNDSDEVKQAIDAGLVESIKLEKADLSTAADEFEDFMDSAVQFPFSLEGYESIRLHEDKVDARLLPILESLATKVDPDGWLSLSEEIANSYMFFLATSIAKRRAIGKATDNRDAFAVDSYYQFDGNFDSFIWNPEASEVAVSLIVPQLLPRGIEQDSMARVLDFRRKHEEARVTYRGSVLDLAEHLKNVKSPTHTKRLIQEFNAQLLNSKSSSGERPWASLGEFTLGALAVGLPLAAGAFLDKTSMHWAVAVGNIAIIGIATMADAHRSARKEWKKTDAFYHLSLHGHFPGASSNTLHLPDYSRTFHEFMDD